MQENVSEMSSGKGRPFRLGLNVLINEAFVGSDDGLSAVQRQLITWTSTGLLLTEHLGTVCSDSRIKTLQFSYINMKL